MANICVLALIGLPGAGKTTFCKNILICPLEYNFIHICYDEMFKYHAEGNEVTFKIERKKVIQKIEQTIDAINLNSLEVKESSNSLRSTVILVDDNNYYAGMRYEIYKLCKTKQLAFGQVYFPVELDSALARNTARGSNTLPFHVIIKMNERLEIPSDKNQWEKNTFVLNICEEIEQFGSFLKTCFLNPLKSIQKTNGGPTEVSFIHEVDLGLRKRIKEILQNSEGNLRENAAILNKKRKYILLDMQKGNVNNGNLNVQSICASFNL